MVEQLDENALNIYTDGSCYQHPRVGGVGYLYITVDDEGHEVIHPESPPGWRSATNNQMELQACIEAPELALGRRSPFDLSKFNKIVIRTDSLYVADNFYNAKYVWPKSRWKTRDGPPVANTDQWKTLVKLAKNAPIKVEIKWVKGHKRDPYNLRVDELAKKSATTPSKRTLKLQGVRRKQSPYEVERGSVKMEGQEITLLITYEEWLGSPHRCFSYKYTVMDQTSPYHLRRDMIWSNLLLRAGHTYRVRVNDNTLNPWIEEMLSEVKQDEADR